MADEDFSFEDVKRRLEAIRPLLSSPTVEAAPLPKSTRDALIWARKFYSMIVQITEGPFPDWRTWFKTSLRLSGLITEFETLLECFFIKFDEKGGPTIIVSEWSGIGGTTDLSEYTKEIESEFGVEFEPCVPIEIEQPADFSDISWGEFTQIVFSELPHTRGSDLGDFLATVEECNEEDGACEPFVKFVPLDDGTYDCYCTSPPETLGSVFTLATNVLGERGPAAFLSRAKWAAVPPPALPQTKSAMLEELPRLAALITSGALDEITEIPPEWAFALEGTREIAPFAKLYCRQLGGASPDEEGMRFAVRFRLLVRLFFAAMRPCFHPEKKQYTVAFRGHPPSNDLDTFYRNMGDRISSCKAYIAKRCEEDAEWAVLLERPAPVKEDISFDDAPFQWKTLFDMICGKIPYRADKAKPVEDDGTHVDECTGVAVRVSYDDEDGYFKSFYVRPPESMWVVLDLADEVLGKMGSRAFLYGAKWEPAIYGDE